MYSISDNKILLQLMYCDTSVNEIVMVLWMNYYICDKICVDELLYLVL